tara:strand:+ start:688 stop:825 length:138 start_codon:yes stop_codon:yes gene_type:complete
MEKVNIRTVNMKAVQALKLFDPCVLDLLKSLFFSVCYKNKFRLFS